MTILSKLNLSKERIEELQQGLVTKREELEKRSTKTAGRLKDASLTTIYEFGANTLGRAAELSEGVPVVGGRADGLRKQAESLKEASAKVQRPPIEGYDDLNVQEVSQALEGLNAYELEKVRRYEEANKDRVTVIRAIDSLIG